MPTEFTMPKLGLTMEEGTIVEWLVDDGGELVAGAPALVIETDKTETEVEAVASGRLQRIADVGDTLACGETIGFVLAEGEEPGPVGGSSGAGAPAATTGPADPAPNATVTSNARAGAAPVSSSEGGGRLFASPNARRIAAEAGIAIATVRGTGPGGRIVSADVDDVLAGRVEAGEPRRSAVPPAAPDPGTSTGATPAASVAARQLADLLGIDLREVRPDPTERRITKMAVAHHVRDRLNTAATPAEAETAGSLPATAPLLQEPTETIRMRGMRGTIAKRMHASLREMAQLTLTMDADMDAVVADRSHRKEAGAAPGITDYVIAAVAKALRHHPRMNAQVVDDGIAVLPGIHVGLAVALDEGLVVPVIRNADQLGLDELAAETTRLADAARSGSLELSDLEGGTFSVTALGMFGVDAFTPVINPPNAGILGVGRIREDVVLTGDTDQPGVSTSRRATLSLTWDHRVLDGAPAAEFTKTVVELLADPSAI